MEYKVWLGVHAISSVGTALRLERATSGKSAGRARDNKRRGDDFSPAPDVEHKPFRANWRQIQGSEKKYEKWARRQVIKLTLLLFFPVGETFWVQTIIRGEAPWHIFLGEGLGTTFTPLYAGRNRQWKPRVLREETEDTSGHGASSYYSSGFYETDNTPGSSRRSQWWTDTLPWPRMGRRGRGKMK